jgi:hypothetical protein
VRPDKEKGKHTSGFMQSAPKYRLTATKPIMFLTKLGLRAVSDMSFKDYSFNDSPYIGENLYWSSFKTTFITETSYKTFNVCSECVLNAITNFQENASIRSRDTGKGEYLSSC